MKDHADRQRRLDRDIRVDALLPGFATGWSTPGFDGVLSTTRWSGHHGDVGLPRILASCEPGMETWRTCTGCVSDTSRVVAPDRGQAENDAPNRRSGAMHQSR